MVMCTVAVLGIEFVGATASIAAVTERGSEICYCLFSL